jgi:hypothetical protein
MHRPRRHRHPTHAGESPASTQVRGLFEFSFSAREEEAESCAQQQCTQQLFPVPYGDETCSLWTDFEYSDWHSSDSTTTASALTASSFDLKSATAGSTAKAVGNLGHGNNGFVARYDGLPENALHLRTG